MPPLNQSEQVSPKNSLKRKVKCDENSPVVSSGSKKKRKSPKIAPKPFREEKNSVLSPFSLTLKSTFVDPSKADHSKKETMQSPARFLQENDSLIMIEDEDETPKLRQVNLSPQKRTYDSDAVIVSKPHINYQTLKNSDFCLI